MKKVIRVAIAVAMLIFVFSSLATSLNKSFSWMEDCCNDLTNCKPPYISCNWGGCTDDNKDCKVTIDRTVYDIEQIDVGVNHVSRFFEMPYEGDYCYIITREGACNRWSPQPCKYYLNYNNDKKTTSVYAPKYISYWGDLYSTEICRYNEEKNATRKNYLCYNENGGNPYWMYVDTVCVSPIVDKFRYWFSDIVNPGWYAKDNAIKWKDDKGYYFQKSVDLTLDTVKYFQFNRESKDDGRNIKVKVNASFISCTALNFVGSPIPYLYWYSMICYGDLNSGKVTCYIKKMLGIIQVDEARQECDVEEGKKIKCDFDNIECTIPLEEKKISPQVTVTLPLVAYYTGGWGWGTGEQKRAVYGIYKICGGDENHCAGFHKYKDNKNILRGKLNDVDLGFDSINEEFKNVVSGICFYGENFEEEKRINRKIYTPPKMSYDLIDKNPAEGVKNKLLCHCYGGNEYQHCAKNTFCINLSERRIVYGIKCTENGWRSTFEGVSPAYVEGYIKEVTISDELGNAIKYHRNDKHDSFSVSSSDLYIRNESDFIYVTVKVKNIGTLNITPALLIAQNDYNEYEDNTNKETIKNYPIFEIRRNKNGDVGILAYKDQSSYLQLNESIFENKSYGFYYVWEDSNEGKIKVSRTSNIMIVNESKRIDNILEPKEEATFVLALRIENWKRDNLKIYFWSSSDTLTLNNEETIKYVSNRESEGFVNDWLNKENIEIDLSKINIWNAKLNVKPDYYVNNDGSVSYNKINLSGSVKISIEGKDNDKITCTNCLYCFASNMNKDSFKKITISKKYNANFDFAKITGLQRYLTLLYMPRSDLINLNVDLSPKNAYSEIYEHSKLSGDRAVLVGNESFIKSLAGSWEGITYNPELEEIKGIEGLNIKITPGKLLSFYLYKDENSKYPISGIEVYGNGNYIGTARDNGFVYDEEGNLFITHLSSGEWLNLTFDRDLGSYYYITIYNSTDAIENESAYYIDTINVINSTANITVDKDTDVVIKVNPSTIGNNIDVNASLKCKTFTVNNESKNGSLILNINNDYLNESCKLILYYGIDKEVVRMYNLTTAFLFYNKDLYEYGYVNGSILNLEVKVYNEYPLTYFSSQDKSYSIKAYIYDGDELIKTVNEQDGEMNINLNEGNYLIKFEVNESLPGETKTNVTLLTSSATLNVDKWDDGTKYYSINVKKLNYLEMDSLLNYNFKGIIRTKAYSPVILDVTNIPSNYALLNGEKFEEFEIFNKDNKKYLIFVPNDTTYTLYYGGGEELKFEGKAGYIDLNKKEAGNDLIDIRYTFNCNREDGFCINSLREKSYDYAVALFYSKGKIKNINESIYDESNVRECIKLDYEINDEKVSRVICLYKGVPAVFDEYVTSGNKEVRRGNKFNKNIKFEIDGSIYTSNTKVGEVSEIYGYDEFNNKAIYLLDSYEDAYINYNERAKIIKVPYLSNILVSQGRKDEIYALIPDNELLSSPFANNLDFETIAAYTLSIEGMPTGYFYKYNNLSQDYYSFNYLQSGTSLNCDDNNKIDVDNVPGSTCGYGKLNVSLGILRVGQHLIKLIAPSEGISGNCKTHGCPAGYSCNEDDGKCYSNTFIEPIYKGASICGCDENEVEENDKCYSDLYLPTSNNCSYNRAICGEGKACNLKDGKCYEVEYEEYSCSSDDECDGKCYNGYCYNENTGIDKWNCTVSGCEDGYVCNGTTGKCMRYCNSDEDCSEGYNCISNLCYNEDDGSYEEKDSLNKCPEGTIEIEGKCYQAYKPTKETYIGEGEEVTVEGCQYLGCEEGYECLSNGYCGKPRVPECGVNNEERKCPFGVYVGDSDKDGFGECKDVINIGISDEIEINFNGSEREATTPHYVTCSLKDGKIINCYIDKDEDGNKITLDKHGYVINCMFADDKYYASQSKYMFAYIHPLEWNINFDIIVNPYVNYPIPIKIYEGKNQLYISYCGNGICEEKAGENCNNCFADCGCEKIVNAYTGSTQPPHTTYDCVEGKCVIECEESYGNCNGNWNDGCETNLSNHVFCPSENNYFILPYGEEK